MFEFDKYKDYLRRNKGDFYPEWVYKIKMYGVLMKLVRVCESGAISREDLLSDDNYALYDKLISNRGVGVKSARAIIEAKRKYEHI